MFLLPRDLGIVRLWCGNGRGLLGPVPNGVLADELGVDLKLEGWYFPRGIAKASGANAGADSIATAPFGGTSVTGDPRAEGAISEGVSTSASEKEKDSCL